MEVFLIRLLQFMLAISLLVLLHEGGHFFFAKLFGVRVDKFYLFFDPWFHLFEFKPKNSDTAYGIGYLQSDEFVRKCAALRGSVLMIGPLLARYGRAMIVLFPLPDGALIITNFPFISLLPLNQFLRITTHSVLVP